MNHLIASESEMLFSVGAVEEQLEKIFRDPHFTVSAILRKFLSFIVQETIQGRSNCLKEYTIAVKVLEKPPQFNPQENGIVRIHAGRLRRSLSQYYSDLGRNDQIIITIPKGKYVPVFAQRLNTVTALPGNDDYNSIFPVEESSNITLAVLPFICSSEDETARSFADGLCMQVSSMLQNLGNISVIAYPPIKNFVELHQDYRELGTSLGFNHIISGGIQIQKNKLRVNVQLIECNSFRQTWSDILERKLTGTNLFEVQDEVCKLILQQVAEMESMIGSRQPAVGSENRQLAAGSRQ